MLKVFLLPTTFSALVDRADAFGQRIPLTLAVPASFLYLASMTLWAFGFEAVAPEFIFVFAPVWAPACRARVRQGARANRFYLHQSPMP